MKKYYLAYGSNLNLSNMSRRCPLSKPISKVMINGYRLVYKGSFDNDAYLTIEEDINSSIPMGLFQLSSFDICYLDFYEGYPSLYRKEYFDVTVRGRKKKALIYIMNDEYDYHIPSDRYVLTCEEGYKDFKFDISYLNNAYKYTENIVKNRNNDKIKRLIK